jgi:hypothetical protein
MVYDYTKKSRTNFHKIIDYVNDKPVIVGNLMMGKKKRVIRLNSSFIKEKGQKFLTVWDTLPPQ